MIGRRLLLSVHRIELYAASVHSDLRTNDVQALVPQYSSSILGMSGYAFHLKAGLNEAQTE